jgi:F420-dependent oxidoreductase-like protein
MKFGIHNSSWLFGPDPYELFAATQRRAQWAEGHGFAWFSVMDHVIQIPGVGVADEPFLEGWTALSALASVTSRIRLATLVSSVAYRNPAHLAKIAAGVDLISRGRLTLGIGAGWHETEYKQYGWEFLARPSVRVRQMEEAIRVIRAMWQEPRATFHGQYFHIQDAILEPKPVQKPGPPILIGGSGEKLTLRAVARLGDGCNITGDLDTVQRKFAVLRRHCDTEGRNFDEIERTTVTNVLLARDEAALKAKFERLNTPAQLPGVVGTVSQVMEVLDRYQEIGIQLFIANIYKNDTETEELLATEIMPHFA